MASLVLNGNTSGSITLSSPAVSGTTVLTLPTVTGGTLVTSDSSGNVGIGTTSPTAKLNVFRADSVLTGLFSGTTKGARIGTNSTYSFIEGVDTTGSASYQPFMIGGSEVRFTTSDTERIRIDSSGNLLVGKTSTSPTTVVGNELRADGQTYTTLSSSTNANSTLNVYSTGAGAYRFYVSMDGKVNCTSTTIAAISDKRLKENIRDLNSGLNDVMALKPRLFDWKKNKGQNTKNVRGFIAQEFEQVFPDLISEWKDSAPEGEEPYKAISQDLIPTLVKAIQEQQTIINDLKARIETLESK